MDAYTGLLAGMCCIGACYSDRLSPSHVREMMNFLKIALERDSNFFSGGVSPDSKMENGASIGGAETEIEKLQALVLLLSLLVWNGTPMQRESAMRLFPFIAASARKSRLTQVSADSSLYSVYHQPDLSLQHLDPRNFDWNSWVEQEKRVRLMHLIYLCDVAHGLYFNAPPQFNCFEIHIPLPADDASWESDSANQCAEALGLYGSDGAKARNPEGSQRVKQPELHLAVTALLTDRYRILPGSTNIYSKFILVHSLIALNQRVQAGGTLDTPSDAVAALSHVDWVESDGSGGTGASGAGVSQAFPPDHTLNVALDKFKANWDMDMLIQFPPTVHHPRRYGFSRDAVHFFYLASWMLKNPQTAHMQLPPDHRFVQVIQLLKSVKAWVMSDGASRGEELGSVSDIDNNYGVSDLTLDMAQLFKPLPEVVESAEISSVRTDI